MAQRQEYTRTRVDPNGDVILERTYKDDVRKEDVLEKLNDELQEALDNRARINRRINKLQNRIAAVTAL